MYKRTLAATTIPNIVIKVFQRFHVIHLSSGFQSIRSFSDKKLLSFKENQRNEATLKRKKEESVKSLGYDLGKIALKRLQYAFSNLKNLELKSYQQKSAILSLKQIVSGIVFSELKVAFSMLKDQATDFKMKLDGIAKLENIAIKVNLRISLVKIESMAKSNDKKSTAIERIEKIMTNGIKVNANKRFDLWKAFMLEKQTEDLSKKYMLQSAAKGAHLRLNYPLRRIYKDSFKAIKEHSLNQSYQKKYKYGLLLLFSSLRKVLNRTNDYAFSMLEHTPTRIISPPLYVLRTLLASRLSMHFHAIMAHYKSCLQSKYLQFALFLQKTNESSKYRNLIYAWNQLKPKHESKLNKLNLERDALSHSKSSEFLKENLFLSPISNNPRSSVNSNCQSPQDLFKSLHTELTERELEQLAYISPSESNSFIPINSEESSPDSDRNQQLGIYCSPPLEIPSSPRSMHIQQSSAVQTSGHFPDIQGLQKRRVNSEQAFYKPLIVKSDSTSSAPKLINLPKKTKFIVKKSSGRPPWKPTSVSSGFNPVKRLDVSPTNLRMKYANDLKERMQKIQEKKSVMQTEENSQDSCRLVTPRSSKYENDPVFRRCVKNLTPVQTPIVSNRATPMLNGGLSRGVSPDMVLMSEESVEKSR